MKVVFFLRHYNDTDHLVPVVHEATMSPAIDPEVVITSDGLQRDDYRLQALADDDVPIRHVSDFGVTAIDTQSSPPPLLRRIGRRAPTEIPEKIWRYSKAVRGATNGGAEIDPTIVSMVDSLYEGTERPVLVHDWVTTNMAPRLQTFVSTVSKRTAELEIPLLALPHGDAPYRNELFKKDLLDFDEARAQYQTGEYFDSVVVPNSACTRRYEPHLPTSRIKVLGSPRYNEVWLNRLAELLPTDTSLPEGDELHVAFFLRSDTYAINWPELRRTARLVANIPGVTLLLQKHTRGLAEKLDSLDHPSIDIVDESVHSPVLLEWCDVAMDLGTSVVFEAIMRKKPVLEVEYLHPNQSTTAAYIDDAAVHTRDDLHHAVQTLRGSTAGFYEPTQRNSFINNVVAPRGPDVLDRYIEVLKRAKPERGNT